MLDDFEDESESLDKRKVFHEGQKLVENNAELDRTVLRYGVCGECRYFEYIRTTFDKEFSQCGMFDWARPRTEDTIKVCSGFYPKGQLDLASMFGIATNIDDTKKKEVGFKLVNDGEG